MKTSLLILALAAVGSPTPMAELQRENARLKAQLTQQSEYLALQFQESANMNQELADLFSDMDGPTAGLYFEGRASAYDQAAEYVLVSQP